MTPRRHLPRFGHAPAHVQAVDPEPYNPNERVRRRGALAFGYGDAIRFRRTPSMPRPRQTGPDFPLLALAFVLALLSAFLLSRL
jgi:hypothetical protein